MMPAITVAADLTVSISDHTIRIHGENSDLAVDADSWRPLLRMRSARRLVDTVRGTFPLGTGCLRVKVRSVPVITIRLDRDRLSPRPHPLGVIRSLLRR